jgi:molybdenum cofactor cytidylyltransferase
VLAAGQSRRYGPDDKLLGMLQGRPLCMHIAATLAEIPLLSRIAVCANPQVGELYRSMGFKIVVNPDPGTGQGSSLRLGIDALHHGRAALLCLADMPFVSGAHLAALARAYDAGQARAVASVSDAYRGPPALIALELLRHFRPQGDVGARELLSGAAWIKTPARECLDFDTKAAFDGFDPV